MTKYAPATDPEHGEGRQHGHRQPLTRSLSRRACPVWRRHRRPLGRVVHPELLGDGPDACTQRSCEVRAGVESVVGRFRQRLRKDRAEIGQLRPAFGDLGRWRGEVLADHDGGIGVVEQRHAGEEMESRGGQGILIGPPVDLGPHQLFGRGVGDGPDRHGGRGQTGGVIEAPGDPEVGEQCAWPSRVEVGQQDVGGLDVAVQQKLLVRVVERAGDLADQAAPRRPAASRGDTCPAAAARRRCRRRSPSISTVDRRIPRGRGSRRCWGGTAGPPCRLPARTAHGIRRRH